MPIIRSFRYQRSLQALAFVLLALVSSMGFATDRVAHLVEISGIKAVLDATPEQAAASFSQEFEKGSQLNMGDDFEAMVKGVLSENTGYAEVHAALSKELSKRQIRKLLKWYESKLGLKITALEVAQNDPKQMERAMAQMNSLLGDASKIGRARQLDELLGLTDISMHSLEVTQVALVGAMLSGSDIPEAAKQSILADVKKTIVASRSEVEEFTLAMAAFTYGTLSDAEYNAYFRFLQSSGAERLNKAAVDAITDNLSRTFATLGQHIQARLADIKSSTMAAGTTSL